MSAPPRASPAVPSARHCADLIAYKVYAELRAEAARTYVGFVWWILEPVISLGVYYAVFAWFMSRGGPDFVAFLFVGIVSFRWLAASISHGARSILQEGGLMQRVYLPKVVFPTVSVLTDAVKFLFVLAALLAFLRASGHPAGGAWAALPALLAVQFLLILALAYALAAVVPLLPDLQIVLDHAIRLAFFLSGIFYPIASVPEPYRFLLRLNPIAVLIEAQRAVLLENRLPDWGPVLAIAAASLAGVGIGVAQLRHFDRSYPKLC